MWGKLLEIEEVVWVFLIPCLFLPLPSSHTSLLGIYWTPLCPSQCQAQGIPQVKAHRWAHEHYVLCQQPGRALKWTLNWGWHLDGQKDKVSLAAGP